AIGCPIRTPAPLATRRSPTTCSSAATRSGSGKGSTGCSVRPRSLRSRRRRSRTTEFGGETVPDGTIFVPSGTVPLLRRARLRGWRVGPDGQRLHLLLERGAGLGHLSLQR